ncbi:hypothetical protein CORC01_09992 [Colletotrichum orchidophilum]|uniref:Uncharacterized protein n=1 Tax=Colletotrichum orchidophilum TaxID=1209926 RepID=A0A1G4B023_9PEZI|nr:uncharacterized protein CORC01_09992 [Colletotrichum orchidophilum]OHE94683.1 hypothetical protein CORC01_09992 [Colletotrichum orchidophilum]
MSLQERDKRRKQNTNRTSIGPESELTASIELHSTILGSSCPLTRGIPHQKDPFLTRGWPNIRHIRRQRPIACYKLSMTGAAGLEPARAVQVRATMLYMCPTLAHRLYGELAILRESTARPLVLYIFEEHRVGSEG